MNIRKTMAGFALTIEPENRALIARMEKINQQRKQNLPTIPSTIEQEIATNPFFRVHSPELQKTTRKQDATLIEVFTEVRKRKDQF